MRYFNSFQIVISFTAWPFLISWLSDAAFKGSSVAFYAACGAYVVSFLMMVNSVADSMRKDGPWDWF